MRGEVSRLVGKIFGVLLVALSVPAIVGSGRALAQDRLLGMVEPVKANKPYRIAYASADMNADFFLALAYGVMDEAQRAAFKSSAFSPPAATARWPSRLRNSRSSTLLILMR